MGDTRRRKLRMAATLVVVFLAVATPAFADPGLSSLKGLLPLYIMAFSLILLALYVLPVWLTFRAKKKFSEGRLSRKQLVHLIAPAALVGIAGLLDFLVPIGLVSGLLYGVGGPSGLAAYWIFLPVSALLVYLAWSTYQQCRDVSKA